MGDKYAVGRICFAPERTDTVGISWGLIEKDYRAIDAQHDRKMDKEQAEDLRREKIEADVSTKFQNMISELASDYIMEESEVRDIFREWFDWISKRPAHYGGWK